MLGRLLRLAPVAITGWRMWQNHQRKKAVQGGDGVSGPSPATGHPDQRRR